MKHLFIINPAAGPHDSFAAVSEAVKRAFAAKQRGSFELYVTRGPMDAAEKVRYESDYCDALRVYACGGDGTLNECVCGAYGRGNVTLAHYPTGTENNFIRAFGPETDRFRALEDLLDGTPRLMDLMLCNDRPCLNVCCMGADARLGADRRKHSGLPLLGGPVGYLTGTAANLFKGVADELRVSCGGKLYYGSMSLICACNGSWYGGGFHPVPEARPDDGVLDFLIVRGVSRLTFLRLMGRYARGEYAKYPNDITHVRGDSMTIRGTRELSVSVDGEQLRAKTIELKLLPKALSFLLPGRVAEQITGRTLETV